MRAFEKDVKASDILKSCEVSLGLKASDVKIREAPHRLDEAGTQGFTVKAGNRTMKVLAPGENSDLCFH